MTSVAGHDHIVGRCLAVDLEVGRRDGRIHAFAAVRADSGEGLTFHRGDLLAAVDALDAFADGAQFLLGHNLIAFDLPHLQAVRPHLRLLRLPPIDTLRLNPLAFPRNPYHGLVKHYQDGQLKHDRVNDPELDARLALQVFGEQLAALETVERELLAAWHWLTTTGARDGAGFDAVFAAVRDAPRPSDAEAGAAIRNRLAGFACRRQALELSEPCPCGWPLAYALAWLSVSGTNSVMPPWVRHQFPEAGELVRRLRQTPCGDTGCDWCCERHDANKELARCFGFAGFRPEPAGEDGRSLQQAIVEAALAGEHVLGILPTGTGKSLCYQVPALSRYEKTGALTVVISPLVALMADQVAGLEKHNIGCCTTINGLLSMPERADALDRVRLGDAGILIVSPEQLRSVAVRRALAQREIGAWVLDEAHCLSRWGHDFRPDYRYVARFIGERAPDAPVLCLTATAKPAVREDIRSHFHDKLDIDLRVFDGGAQRTNLEFAVAPTSGHEKFAHVHQWLLNELPPRTPGGAIVYCATRRRTEEVAAFLRAKGIAADHFHAGLPPETRKTVQQRFIAGELRVIVATNAFGMGVDKPDVRLVIHADVPGSLENYLQEAGRAGRDRATARCVLLYTPEDVERQFGLSARSRLTRRQIHAILKALRRLDRRKRTGGEVIATGGEILGEDQDAAFERDRATDDTRVRTALSWLEEADLLTREENRVQVFPSSLRVGSLAEARGVLAGKPLESRYRRQLEAIAERLIDADPDEGITTDELMGASGLGPQEVRRALHDLERLGIAGNDTAVTAFVHRGVPRASTSRLAEAVGLERALVDHLREAAPDMEKGDASTLHLRVATQRIKGAGHPSALPERIWRLLQGLARDGRGERDDRGGSLGLRRLGPEAVRVTLHRDWEALAETAERRRIAGLRLLEHLLSSLPERDRGTDLLAETTFGKLLDAIRADLILQARAREPEKLLDRALLWLHEQEVIRLNKGLSVFRPAMSIHLSPGRRGFADAHFAPLRLHYQDQVLQIHVMDEFVQRGLKEMADALLLAMDYFRLPQEDFLRRWLPDRGVDIARQTTPESWRRIVESLRNVDQQRIVADDREQANVLVLAGPGAGKTRVLVHRIAYLVRVRREDPRGVLALAYNRHAAAEIRRRLEALIGEDARGVSVLTCHGFAMRLVGASFAGRAEPLDDDAFRDVMQQAVEVLCGRGLPPEDAGEMRTRLLSGFRWVLIDEYQDVGPEQYALVAAIAGRSVEDGDERLGLFAVGDDDQNVYAFSGASVRFIRRFEQDYGAGIAFLIDNYRSTAHIVAAANTVIERTAGRMKAGRPIRVDEVRRDDPPGGDWQRLDPLAGGRVQVLPVRGDAVVQAQAAVIELQRLAALSSDWDWSRCAVIAREWRYLEPVRACCEHDGIPVQSANEAVPSFWRLRETQALLASLHAQGAELVEHAALEAWRDGRPPGPWTDLLAEAITEYLAETGGTDTPLVDFQEWLAEWGRDVRRRQYGLLLLTAHRAKGLEFDHVVVLDGGWDRAGAGEDAGAPRRLRYVAMTRARRTLALTCFEGANCGRNTLPNGPAVLCRAPFDPPPQPAALERRYRRLGLGDVDLGFAGRRPPAHLVHRAIASLAPGDALAVQVTDDRWRLLDGNGTLVGQLSRAFEPPPGMRCRSAAVLAVVAWNRKISDPRYHDGIESEAWEVLVPELVFEPDA